LSLRIAHGAPRVAIIRANALVTRRLNAPDITSVKGLRGRAIIAVLLGCGMRRSEVSGAHDGATRGSAMAGGALWQARARPDGADAGLGESSD